MKNYASILIYQCNISATMFLKAMGRKGNANEIKALIEKIRDKIPEAVIRTTFIVGFPERKMKTLKSYMILQISMNLIEWECLNILERRERLHTI